MYQSRYNGNRGHNAAKTKNKKNGIILAKLVNIAAPGTVDERVIVKDPGMTTHDKESYPHALSKKCVVK